MSTENNDTQYNYNISEWVKVVNSGFRLGQHFFLDDMRNQQEANDAQITLSLSSAEQEQTVSADQEFAEQLDKEMNATPQTRSTPHKKATHRIDKRCPKCYGEFGKHSESGNNKGFLSCCGFTRKEGGSSSPRKT